MAATSPTGLAHLDVAPDYKAFAAAYDKGDAQIVTARLIADLETPVSAYLKLAAGRAGAFKR